MILKIRNKGSWTFLSDISKVEQGTCSVIETPDRKKYDQEMHDFVYGWGSYGDFREDSEQTLIMQVTIKNQVQSLACHEQVYLLNDNGQTIERLK